MNIEEIKKNSKTEIEQADNQDALEGIRIKYVGRSGILTEILKSLKDLDMEERKKIGPLANSLRNEIEIWLNEKKEVFLKKSNHKPIDITMPGKKIELGHLHPLTKVQNELEEIFSSMGFEIAEGPEIETEFYNFDALNIPANHPARDMWDTIWLTPEKHVAEAKSRHSTNSELMRRGQSLLLRAHTSPVQVRYMEKHQPPIRIVAPGKAFRYEAVDASHEFQFYQLEGLMVGKDVSFANFKAVVTTLLKKIFNKNVSVRFRLDYFPFVEPGVEIGVSCPRCHGKGCPLCKNSGWLEIAGAGMVHPKVFEAVGYNPKDVQGFAFGFGIDRIAMVKYGIPDIRLINSGDLRFIKQF